MGDVDQQILCRCHRSLRWNVWVASNKILLRVDSLNLIMFINFNGSTLSQKSIGYNALTSGPMDMVWFDFRKQSLRPNEDPGRAKLDPWAGGSTLQS